MKELNSSIEEELILIDNVAIYWSSLINEIKLDKRDVVEKGLNEFLGLPKNINMEALYDKKMIYLKKIIESNNAGIEYYESYINNETDYIQNKKFEKFSTLQQEMIKLEEELLKITESSIINKR